MKEQKVKKDRSIRPAAAAAFGFLLLVIVLIFTLAQFSMEDRYANN